MKKILIFLIFIISGCSTFISYHDTLIETSLVSEIPTVMGNLVGNVAGAPFLVFSLPTGYIASSSDEEEERNNRIDIIIFPLKVGSYLFGTIFGTPFYPFAVIFPRTKLKHDIKED